MKTPSLVFEPRPSKENKYQVRFWCVDPSVYEEFASECGRRGLVMQDVFFQFMEWFIKDSRSKK